MNTLYRIIATSITLSSLLALSAQQVGGSSIAARTYTSADQTCYVEEKVFDNGLGDIIQEQKLGYSGDTCTAIVTHHDYDSYRRETSVWLPTAVQSGGDYVPRNTLATAAVSAYGDQKPYSRTTYDEYWPASPSSTTAAGSTWHDGNHSRHINSTISSITGLGLLPGSSTICLLNNQLLYSETVTDEDGCTRTTYKDEGGRVHVEETAVGRTYYVYDTRTGNLRFVLPPAASSYVLDKAYYTSYSEIDRYAYEYRYDGLNRCIYKDLPGCAPIYYIYDRAGNLILTQDGNLRQAGKWMFTIPDRFGRPCLTGTCQGTYNYTDEPLKGVYVHAEYDGSSSYRGYSIDGITLMMASVYTVAYYDTYDFVGRYEMPSAFSAAARNSADTLNGRGLQTGGIEAYLGATGILGYCYSVVHYNNRKEAVWTGSTNHLGGFTITNCTYSFTGKVLSMETTTQIGSKLYTEKYTYEYDMADRVTRTRHKYGSGTEVTLCQNTYDDLGRLVTVRRLDSNNLTTQIGYNMHSQLKAVRTGTLFEEVLRYEDASNGNMPMYSGAISGIEWKSRNDRTRTYNYTYDQAKRLVSASYLDAAGNNGAFSTSYGYDNMCNLTSLVRHGKLSSLAYGRIDSLTYTYEGNHLTAISDNAPTPTISGSFDFRDGASITAEYLYDANGNMTKDANKGITQIQYNHLNLPSRIAMVKGSSTSTIDYVYSASGAKLRVIHRPNVLSPLSTTTDYVNGSIFTNNSLSMALTDNGYYTFSNTGDSTYHFYLKDHQGNNRVVVSQSGSVEQINHYYPYGALFAESTNGDVQRFKYNGKELDRKFGLNWYDHGARHNDAAIGRWHSMDPMAEKYYGISPYAYCGGDPVNLGDYDGNNAEIIINGNTIIINMAIVLYGQYATGDVRDRFQTLFNETWGKQKTIIYNGQEYSLDWHVTITAKENVTTKERNKGYEDGYHNYLEIVNNDPYDIQQASHVTNNYYGQINKNKYWSESGWNEAGDFPHEFGHLLGLKDHYIYVGEDDNKVPVVEPGWEGEMMSSPAGEGRVTNKTLLPVIGPLLDQYNNSIINRINLFGKKYYIKHNQNTEKNEFNYKTQNDTFAFTVLILILQLST